MHVQMRSALPVRTHRQMRGGGCFMAYNKKAKVKVLYIWKILLDETDEKRGLTMPQIIDRLAALGIPAERKSVYSDLEALREFGIEVKKHARNPVEYAIEDRNFDVKELMLLVDAVESCRAITDRQARDMVEKIKMLTCERERDLLDRRIHVEGRLKSKSNSVLSAVDSVHEAMRMRCKLSFSYRRIGPDGKIARGRSAKTHTVTPVRVSYEDGFYYLSAWDEARESMVEFRLDRMVSLRVLKDEPATRNKDITASRRPDRDAAVRFGRFGGEEVEAVLMAEPGKAGIIVDRFGSVARFHEPNGERALATVKVCKSPQFYGWVAGMSGAVRIVAPKSLVNDYKRYLLDLVEEPL